MRLGNSPCASTASALTTRGPIKPVLHVHTRAEHVSYASQRREGSVACDTLESQPHPVKGSVVEDLGGRWVS
jgi:hypothetical protein